MRRRRPASRACSMLLSASTVLSDVTSEMQHHGSADGAALEPPGEEREHDQDHDRRGEHDLPLLVLSSRDAAHVDAHALRLAWLGRAALAVTATRLLARGGARDLDVGADARGFPRPRVGALAWRDARLRVVAAQVDRRHG